MAVHCVLRKYIHIISSSLIKERSLTFISLSSSYLLSRLLTLWHNSIERKLKITPESPIIEKKNKYFLAFSSPVKIYLKFQFIFFPMQHKTLTKENLNVKHCNDKKNKLISIWGILQKYLIYNMHIGLPMSFCNISFSVGYPEVGWGSWEAMVMLWHMS